MDLWTQIVVSVLSLMCIFQTVCGLSCYSCVSTEAGCGKELNIRLQRWKGCQGTGNGGGENFCVKVIEKQGSEEFITRDCLQTLKRDARHRMRIPTVQRHGYCSPARNDDPWHPNNEKMTYCFCNDWNACNPATNIQPKPSMLFFTILFTAGALLWRFL